MYCKNCGKSLDNKSKFCGECGNQNDEHIDLSKMEIPFTQNDNKADSANDYNFLYIPVSRLIWASVLSFGLYTIYWFSTNWIAIQKVTGQKMSPVWRGVFSVFWSYEPFEFSLKQAKKVNYPYNYNSKFLVGFYFFASILNRVIGNYEGLDPYFALVWLILGMLIVIYPLIKAQNAVNWYSKEKGKSPIAVGLPEFGLIGLGWVIVLLTAFGS